MGEANGTDPTEEISAAMVGLCADFYDHERTTATTYINDNVVVCVLEDILSVAEGELDRRGRQGAVIDGRVAFQKGAEDEFTAAIQRITGTPGHRVHEREPDRSGRRLRAVLPRATRRGGLETQKPPLCGGSFDTATGFDEAGLRDLLG